MMNDFIEQAKNVLKIEAEAVSSLIGRIDERFTEAIDLLYSCSGKVVVTGIGKSGIIGKKIAATLASTGTPALYLNSAEGSHGDLGMVSKGDVVIAISNSGETGEVLNMLPTLKRLDIKIIGMTGNMDSTLTKRADISLDVSVKEEACPMGLAPTASTTAALAMGDTLAIMLLKKRGFSEDDFAVFHPGGNLGRKLLLTVADLMHHGSAVPIVHKNTLMKEAIMEISTKRLGITAVVNDDSRLHGVITDGDLRRGLEKWGEKFFSLQAGDAMSHSPKTISKEMLAAKAVSIMEKNSITVLMVTDSENNIDGLIHLHDLLKAGIV